MTENSKIEWTDMTWNPITGCTKISTGCKNCYAERMANRLRGRCGYPADEPFRVTFHPDKLDEPIRWKKPKRIFVCSMGDLFHEAVPDDFIMVVFTTMAIARLHTFQILTKHSERMLETTCQWNRDDLRYIGGRLLPLTNVWMGVSIESAAYLDRLENLRRTHASVRFVSFEPLLGDMGQLDLTGIHWVIVGGESGPKARPMHPNWVRSIRNQCVEAGVPFFFKQWEGGKKAAGRLLDGRTWDEMPTSVVPSLPFELAPATERGRQAVPMDPYPDIAQDPKCEKRLRESGEANVSNIQGIDS